MCLQNCPKQIRMEGGSKDNFELTWEQNPYAGIKFH